MLDSYALLAYLKREDKYQQVIELLKSSSEDNFLIMNEINIGESYYIIARERNSEQAEYFIQQLSFLIFPFISYPIALTRL